MKELNLAFMSGTASAVSLISTVEIIQICGVIISVVSGLTGIVSFFIELKRKRNGKN